MVTDIAARGVDIPALDVAINFHFPAKAKLFVHRVGRVARAGRPGRALSLVSIDELPYLIDLYLFLGTALRLPIGVKLAGALEGGLCASVGARGRRRAGATSWAVYPRRPSIWRQTSWPTSMPRPRFKPR